MGNWELVICNWQLAIAKALLCVSLVILNPIKSGSIVLIKSSK